MVYSEMTEVFDTEIDKVNTVIIENQVIFTKLCMDIYNQLQGLEGRVIVSEDNKPLNICKKVELLTQFLPFEINKKGLITKLVSMAERLANENDYYEETMTQMAGIEKYLWSLTESMEGDIRFSKLSIGNIIKSAGLEFEDDYNSLGEKIIDYMELVRTYDCDKLFILVNLRSFINDNECFELFDTILRKQFHVIMIENCEHEIHSNEKRFIIDKDYCEIK
ncbi:type II-A CRISPR-associated protein Csn2 [Acetitomaculum ruminis]|nr:type II-A CRISPR-associated protein Csn2 [Acetitomaculum ruminis]